MHSLILSTKGYIPSETYKQYKMVEQCTWPDEDLCNLSLSEKRDVMNRVLSDEAKKEWIEAYNKLSNADKTQIDFENHMKGRIGETKDACLNHLTFIGIGVIRTIPLVGGLARYFYVKHLRSLDRASLL
jgi:hypothetical protein